MSDARYPALFQINTRAWLTELSRTLGRRATLDDISDTEMQRMAEMGFDWVWLLSIATLFGEVRVPLPRFRCAGCGQTETGASWPSHCRSSICLRHVADRAHSRGTRLQLGHRPRLHARSERDSLVLRTAVVVGFLLIQIAAARMRSLKGLVVVD